MVEGALSEQRRVHAVQAERSGEVRLQKTLREQQRQRPWGWNQWKFPVRLAQVVQTLGIRDAKTPGLPKSVISRKRSQGLSCGSQARTHPIHCSSSPNASPHPLRPAAPLPLTHTHSWASGSPSVGFRMVEPEHPLTGGSQFCLSSFQRCREIPTSHSRSPSLLEIPLSLKRGELTPLQPSSLDVSDRCEGC